MRLALVVYGSLDQPTGGYLYDRALRAGLLQRGWSVDLVSLPTVPAGFHPEHTRVLIRQLNREPVPDIVVEDGLASGSCLLANLALRARRSSRIVTLVHHLSWSECRHTSKPGHRLRGTQAREWASLITAHRVVVTSEHTRDEVRALGIPAQRIGVVEPGVDTQGTPDALIDRPVGADPCRLLVVGTVSWRKGYDVLARALSGLDAPPWRLTVVGALDREPGATRSIRRLVEELGLADRVTFAGAVNGSRLRELYRTSDLFIAPSRYEGYGMAVAEAVASGLPVVATRTGAHAQRLAGGRAGRLVPVDDPAALRHALQELLGDRALREQASMAAVAASRAIPRWEASVLAFEDELFRALA